MPPSSDNPHINVADRLASIAQQMPDAVAVARPGPGEPAGDHSYTTCTFGELDADATSLARALVDRGVGPQTRLALMVKPGVEFVKLVFALLRSGAITVLVDPGMGRRHLLRCLQSVEPEGFVAISPAQAVRAVLKKRFPKARHNVTVGHRWFWGGPTYWQLLGEGRRSTTALPRTQADDPAAIIFTSGSTGPPKGVLYTHRMFDTQVAEIQAQYALHPGGVDLSCFALFGLFNSAMGITTVFPRMDFSRPAAAKCKNLLAAASDWRVTNAFASPAVWDKLSRHCERTGEKIPTLRRVFSCGAPVPATVLRRTLACIHPEAQMHTPYGATEALPIATIEAAEVLGETAEKTDQGAGVCVGRRFDTAEWRVIRITDDPIETIDQAEELPTGETGELIVRGPQVSTHYLSEPRPSGSGPNAFAKIADGPTTWHRMGDVGYLDTRGRFWYCGRKAHRIVTRNGTLFTIPVEAQLNLHPHVDRSALVGVGPHGDQQACIMFQPSIEYWWKKRSKQVHVDVLLEEVREAAKKVLSPHPLAGAWETPGRIPVDVRHNSKINRELLAEWAATHLARGQ